MNIEILFEDEDFLVANKPPRLPVHKTLDPARPHLQQILEAQCGQKLTLFHRIDVDTTGCLICGKSLRSRKAMSEIFLNKEVQKTYWTVVEGRWLEDWKEVTSYIGKISGGRWANVSKGKKGLFARSHFKILKSKGSKSWLEVQLDTGRTHQIRLHCLLNDHPILGDPRYGKAQKQGIPLALHARSLKFKHPFTKKECHIEAPLPDYWKEYWIPEWI